MDALKAPYDFARIVPYRARDIEIERNLTLNTASRSWWNSADTTKFFGARSSIIHRRNHAGASNRETSLIKDTGASRFRSALSSLKAGVWSSAGSEQHWILRHEAIFWSFEETGRKEPRLHIQTESLDRGIFYDLAIISRNEQSKIILLSTFFALTRRRKRITAYSKIRVIRTDLVH